jgi:UDP:flavonoid glycosyltransferase YjiC (YdhE family)
MMARLAARTRGAPGDGLPPERILHYFLPRAFGEIGVDEMIDDVLRVGRDFRPDVVIFEAFALAGPLAADVLGVPAITHLFGPVPPLDAVVLANDAVSPIWRAHGRNVPGWAGMFRDLTIQICPPSLEVADVPVGESMHLRPTVLPKAPASTTEPPLVYVTFGTLFNANLDLFRLVLDALADEPIDVVATVGRDQDPAALPPHPANARVERFVPQADLLPTCSAIVHHGGAGTMFGALAHGVPQVILPQGADNFEHAAMCESAGVAVAVQPDELSADTLVDAVRQVLTDASFAAASGRCAAEIAAMPDASSVVESVREWVVRR